MGKTNNVSVLVALAQELGLAEGGLDEAVHAVAQEVGLAELNEAQGEGAREEAISGREAEAASVNNGGVQAQVTFLVEHLGPAEAEAVVRRAAAPDPCAWTDGYLWWHPGCVEVGEDDVELRPIFNRAEAEEGARCDHC